MAVTPSSFFSYGSKPAFSTVSMTAASLLYSEINGLLSNFNLADYAKNEHILEVKTSVLNQRAFTINELSKKLKNDIQMSR